MHPNAKKISFTPEGFTTLKKEQEELLVQRPIAVTELKKAREMGDLSENGAYKGAKALVGHIDSRLRHLAHLIAHADVRVSGQKGIVDLDAYVVVTDDIEERKFHIVGEHEASPMDGKISHRSPIGSKLMGRKEGERVEIQTPRGIIIYTIVKISQT
jgi:transcription elongation factor GreA